MAPPVSGYAAWWDASIAASITSAGGLVSAWADQSANARNLLQATETNKPTTGTRTQNSLNVLDFQVDNYLQTASFSLSQPITIFLVGKSDTLTNDDDFYAGVSANFFLERTLTTYWQLYAGTNLLGASSTNTQAHVFSSVFNGASSSNRIDGVTDVSGSASTTGISGGFIVGGDRIQTSTKFLDGWVGEIIIYNSVLSTADRESVEGYLIAKWFGDEPAGNALTTLTSDVPFLQSNDRYQLVTCVDQGTSTTTAEFRYWYAGPPLWGEAIAGDESFPATHTLDENERYTPGSLELPFKDFGGKEADIKGILVEFNTRPSSFDEGVPANYSVGFSAHVEGYGVPNYSRTVSGVQTSGMHTTTTVTFTGLAGLQADEPWPNTRAHFFPVRMDQRVKKARVVLTDIHLVEIVNVQLVGDVHPPRTP